MSSYCQVKVCGCGSIYLTIGAMTLKLAPEVFASVVQTLNEVTMPAIAAGRLPKAVN